MVFKMKGVQKAANTYCSVRLIVSSIISIVIGAFLLYWGGTYEKKYGDSSKYEPVIGKIKSGFTKTSVSKNTTYYNNVYNIEYSVNNISYKTTISGNSFTNDVIAYSDIQNNIDREIQIFYNPQNPKQTVKTLNEENLPIVIMLIIGVLLIGGAIVAIILRNNPFFCGTVIATDVISSVKSAFKS